MDLLFYFNACNDFSSSYLLYYPLLRITWNWLACLLGLCSVIMLLIKRYNSINTLFFIIQLLILSIPSFGLIINLNASIIPLSCRYLAGIIFHAILYYSNLSFFNTLIHWNYPRLSDLYYIKTTYSFDLKLW